MLTSRLKLMIIMASVVGLIGMTFASYKAGYWPTLVSDAQAAGGIVKSKTDAAPDRYVYYPGTEALKPDEIRLIACGTGMPAARRDQAATCWLCRLCSRSA